MSHSEQRRPSSVVWKGTVQEELDLIAAVQHNCECRGDGRDEWLTICAGHAMLYGDQRALDGLLWNRHFVGRLLADEGIVG